MKREGWEREEMLHSSFPQPKGKKHRADQPERGSGSLFWGPVEVERLQREGNHHHQMVLKQSQKARAPDGLRACSVPVGITHLL